jgi:hypothetical protein
VSEGPLSAQITVTRFGVTSGTASVDYVTNDFAGISNCDVVGGNASSRCDYLATRRHVALRAGGTSKTILVPIVEDSFAEGSESFTVNLSNATGANLVSPATAIVLVNDNEAVDGSNPIDQAGAFVRQQYVDFLNREPDSAGLAFWSNEITSCGNEQTCIDGKRVNVSAAFFLSIEFQETGYLVYRSYKAAYGNLAGAPVPLTLSEFLPDTQQMGKGVIVGVGNGKFNWKITSRRGHWILSREFASARATRLLSHRLRSLMRCMQTPASRQQRRSATPRSLNLPPPRQLPTWRRVRACYGVCLKTES